MELQRIKTAPKIPELVMQSLLEAIDNGQLMVGTEMPPERELAVSLGVGRNSLRECLAILEYMGVIEAQGNRKIIIKDAGYFRKAVEFIRISQKNNVLLDSVEFRRGVEEMTVKLACERATEHDLSLLKSALDRLDVNTYDHDADIAFHNALAQASHNIMYATTMDLLSTILMSIRINYYKLPKYHKRTHDSHHKIYDAVCQGDSDAAVAAIEEHLQIVVDYTKEAIELGLLEE